MGDPHEAPLRRRPPGAIGCATMMEAARILKAILPRFKKDEMPVSIVPASR